MFNEVLALSGTDEFKSVLADPQGPFHEFAVFILMFKHVCEWVNKTDS